MSESPDQHVDFLIVGHGIAGALLTYELQQAGKSVLVIDTPHHQAASRVAAGIINPVTGRRYVKSWLFDDLWQQAGHTYQQIEKDLGVRFFYQRPLLRSLFNPGEVNHWQHRMTDSNYSPLMGLDADFSEYQSHIQPAFRYGNTQVAAQVDLTTFLDAQIERLQQKGSYWSEPFRYSELNIRPDDGVRYRNITADYCIFCEGAWGKSNPFFNFLPFRGAKGEVLIVKIPDAHFTQMIKQRIFIVPLPEDRYWIGSFYEREFDHDRPTEKGRRYLEDRLRDILKTDFEVVEHRAAIRPTVKDRRPFLGHHPNFPQLVIFNGLGTKGASLAPYFARHLVDHLLHSKSLQAEVDIQRFA
jgi:glycine oxidase